MDTPTNEDDSSQEPTSRKRKREEINDLQVTCKSCQGFAHHTTESGTDLKLVVIKDLKATITSVNGKQRVSMTANVDGATVFMESDCNVTDTQPEKRVKRSTTPSPTRKYITVKKPGPVDSGQTREKPKAMNETSKDKKETTAGEDMDECPICRMGFRSSDKKECLHYVHKNCAVQWLEANDDSHVRIHSSSASSDPSGDSAIREAFNNVMKAELERRQQQKK